MEWLIWGLILQLIVLINPLPSIPMLVAAYKQKMDVKRIALSAVFVAFLVAVIINFIGPILFEIFGVTMSSFQIAGGIILILLGVETIYPRKEKIRDVKKIDGIISIMATPLLTGPATISFITLKTLEIGQMTLFFNLIAAFIIVGIIFFSFALSVSKINMKVIDISSKIFGLFLTALGVELISAGVMSIL